MHCASLGEFEQGRPVLEKLREALPDYFFLLTFFSPSGYNVRKNHPLADHVAYLPPDTREQAAEFLRLTRPAIALLVKYELWYHYIRQLNERQIPTVIFSAIFRKGQFFFKPWGRFFEQELKKLEHIFVQDENSLALLQQRGFSNVSLAYDTRFDRVLAVSSQPADWPAVRQFTEGAVKILVAGSTWPEDDRLLAKYINQSGPEIKFIIAPHQIDPSQIRKFALSLKVPFQSFSSINHYGFKNPRVLIIDKIGMLSGLYRYATVAYVGGGFTHWVHNTLEPAVYGIPVVFGPRNRKFAEIQDLRKAGAGFEVRNYQSLKSTLDRLFTEPNTLHQAGRKAAEYVMSRLGGTGRVANYVIPLLSR